MKKNVEQKEKTVVETVTTYIANDGTVFKNEKECLNYEETALCTAKATLNTLTHKPLCINYETMTSFFPESSYDFDCYYIVKPINEQEVNAINYFMKIVNGSDMADRMVTYDHIGETLIISTDCGDCGECSYARCVGSVEYFYDCFVKGIYEFTKEWNKGEE